MSFLVMVLSDWIMIKLKIKIFFLIIICSSQVTAVPYYKLNSYKSDANNIGIRQAQFANLDYNIVYIRCPRGNVPLLIKIRVDTFF